MKIVGITEAKNNLSSLLEQVRAGETVLITDRGRPVARLESAVGMGGPPEGRLARLERAGIVRPASKDLDQGLLREAPPRGRKDSDIVAVLLEERREHR